MRLVPFLNFPYEDSMRTLLSSRPVLVVVILPACARDPETTAPSHGAAEARTRLTDAKASSTECGATLLTDLNLKNDLTCSGDAIIVAADDIRINLNGHTITGSGVGIGITIREKQHISIVGGTVRGFVTGIFAAQSDRKR